MTTILTSLIGLIGIIPSVLILIASVIILVRTRAAGALLMVIGEALGILSTLFWAISWPILAKSASASHQMVIFSSINQIVGMIAGLLFGIGLILLATKVFRKS